MFLAVVGRKSRRNVVYWIQPLWHSLFACLAIPCSVYSTLPQISSFDIHPSPFTVLQLCLNCIPEARHLHLCAVTLAARAGKALGGPYACALSICIFLFLTISFSVHWLVSKLVLWRGQHLKNYYIYNTCSSDQADHQADEAEKKEPINISSKLYGDAGTKDAIGARKHKGHEVPPFSSLFLDVLTMRKLHLDLTKKHTKIRQSWDTNLHKAKIFNFLYSKDYLEHSIPDNTFTQQYQKQSSCGYKD